MGRRGCKGKCGHHVCSGRGGVQGQHTIRGCRESSLQRVQGYNRLRGSRDSTPSGGAGTAGPLCAADADADHVIMDGPDSAHWSPPYGSRRLTNASISSIKAAPSIDLRPAGWRDPDPGYTRVPGKKAKQERKRGSGTRCKRHALRPWVSIKRVQA